MTNNINKFTSELDRFNCEIIKDVLLSDYTSFKIGGKSKIMIQPKTQEQIINIIKLCNDNNIRYYILGNGSNILVSDDGINAIIINIGEKFSKIKLIDKTTIECQSGAKLYDLCIFAYNNNLTGLEFAYGIPGSVGGAVYMNAGAYGGEIKDVITSVTHIDQYGMPGHYNNVSMLNLGYRTSIYTDQNCCITAATFKLERGNKELIKKKMEELIKKREDKQPLEYPSAGSVFKRPIGNYAGSLISQCNLKGYKLGGAMVSDKHAGFIINAGGATCKDVLNLIDYVKLQVYKQTGYQLECEIKYVE